MAPESATTARRWPLLCHGRRWFRIKGYGVRYTDHRKFPPLYTERNGNRGPRLHVGPHCFMVVRP